MNLDCAKYDRIYEDMNRRFFQPDPGRGIFHGNMPVETAPAEEDAKPSKFGREMNPVSKSIGKIERKRVGGSKPTILFGMPGTCPDGTQHRPVSKGVGRIRCTKCRKTAKRAGK